MTFVIGEFRKNQTEVVRVTTSNFKGFDLVDVRVWVDGYGGVTRPTKQGISLRRELLPELQQAINAAINAPPCAYQLEAAE
ncbi:transcriptional coactivator p15/PC4 family protein [Blastochloris tepida]|uniref:Transcriptional coactivator p15 (PC4) C-terminal domain-containing protein n=1 Tax=Blastochloris tepida TaxID=2233851 RepID=A0A348FXS4_9HYPH|nr:transcriptional coactivator p15/PC4 family protein [Blastochloris tepida]BBF92107.1 hypothetical protein BLTE_07920 [Blastochloris tepida]